MTWRRGDARAASPEDRINRLTCDGIAGWEGEGRDVDKTPCPQQITGVQTATQARRTARAAGWETSAERGDLCPTHRVSRPRR